MADALLHSLALVQAELVFLERQIADLQRRVEIVRAHEGDTFCCAGVSCNI